VHHGRVSPRPLAEEIAARARPAAGLPALAAAVCAAYGTAVPYAFGCLATTDPSTGLISWTWKTSPLDLGDEEWAAAEYGGPDVNQFAELAGRAEPVGVLSMDTGGRPETCLRFRDFLAPRFGFTDELRVVFRSRGLTWGALALHRGPGEPPFSPAEARTAAAVHAQVADLIRAAVFSPPRPAPVTAPGPSVIVVDGADRVVNITAAARTRIEELGGWDHGSLPSTVLATAATARTEPTLATTRAVGRDGAWLTIRATTFADGDRATGDVVITVDLASAADISALTLAARGLSPREQDVAGLVLQGASTRAIAESLHLSPHTVQDHLKSIFARLGVNSRREMVSRLVLR
jgi:DNA-binding CsgD family transcriptional regulator